MPSKSITTWFKTKLIIQATPLFNGNISETFWRTSSDNVLRKYSYSYDHLNRLLEGKYEKPQSTNPFPGSYDERLEYDKNGNILNLRRNGDLDSDSSFMYAQEIDVLGYTYKPDSNLLLSVSDDTANPKGFNDGNTQNDDFEYDNNGNMTVDKNKDIKNITYNHLNLPTKILFDNSNYIMYLYTASGQKMEKRIYENNDRTITDYINGFQYKTLPSGEGGLVFFPHAEGYVNVNESYKLTESSLYNYVFNYTDHLGNIRMSYTQTPTGALSILEENHYYPFGLKHTNYNSDKRLYVRESVTSKIKPVTPLFPLVYNYKYNGKEYQDELGLNVYAMDMRQYDPALGRWMVIDPVTHYTESPYNAFSNNPVYFADPSGASPIYNSTTGQYVINGKQVSFDEAISYANSGGNSDGSNNNNVSDTNNSDAKNGDNSTIKFPKGEDYEKKHPRLTKLVKQIHSYVKNNSDLLYYLSYYSGYSTMEVLEKLEYGKGTELQSWFYTGEDSDNNGWTPNTGNFITVNAKFVNGLEIAKRNETIQATSFLLMTTILHEFIHSSRVKNKLPDTFAEYGKALEKYGFGEDINKRNAHEYYKKNGWDFKY